MLKLLDRVLDRILDYVAAWAAVNTTSFTSGYGSLPAGMTPDKSALFGVLGFLANSNIYDCASLVAVNGAAATTVTLTTAQFFNNIIDLAGSAAGGVALTTPTAAQILAAVPPWAPQGGFNFVQRVMNDNGGQVVTYTAGANVTLQATTATLANNTARDFLVNINVGAGTVTITAIGGALTL